MLGGLELRSRRPFIEAPLRNAEFFNSIAELRKRAQPAREVTAFVRGYYTSGDGGGGMFRWSGSSASADNSGTIIKPTSINGAGRWLRYNERRVSIRAFGAAGDNTADDTAKIQAAVNAVPTLIPSDGGIFKTTATLTIGSSQSLVGEGYGSRINAVGVAGPVIRIGTGDRISAALVDIEVSNFRITGTATEAVRVQGASLVILDRIYAADSFSGTNGFVFDQAFGCIFKHLFTNGATLTNAGFICGQNFNANDCSFWYTSNNNCNYNVLVDKSFEGGAGQSHGSSWKMLTCQGGDIGLYVRQYEVGAFHGVYCENTAIACQLGDFANNLLARGITIDGIDLGGPTNTHRNYATRVAPLELDYTFGCSIRGADFAGGAFNAGTFAPVTFTGGGGGAGAKAIARVTAGGAVHSVEVINPGAGYTVDPGVTFGGAGAGATATVTRSALTVASVAVTAGGAGYTPTNTCPVAIRYNNCGRTAISGHYVNDGNGLLSTLYPWVVRKAGADSSSAVTIHDDVSWRSSNNANAAKLEKTQGFAFKHVLIESDSTGARVATLYTPPQYP